MQNLNLSEEEIKIWGEEQFFNIHLMKKNGFMLEKFLLNLHLSMKIYMTKKNYVHTYRVVLKQLELVKLRLPSLEKTVIEFYQQYGMDKLNKSSSDSI